MAERPFVFPPEQRPTLPGAPANPHHPPARRAGYLVIGCLIGITGGLGNALVAVNLDYAQGTLGLYPDESAWLTAAYFMANVAANLLLVKYRQQFGLQSFVRWVLGVYATAALLHLVVYGFWTAVAVRVASGLAGSGLTTLTVLYVMQGMPPARRLQGAMIGICVPQLATPLARAISPHLLDWGDWHILYCFEFGMALATLAAVRSLPLPPSERSAAFQSADLLTFLLLAPGLWLLIAVLSEGRILWWTEREWLGWALCASIALIVAGLVVEARRSSPLLDMRWLATHEIVRLMLAAAAVRILLSEQSFGSVGLLNAVGMINDQMVALNLIVVGASIAGIAAAILAFNPANVSWPIGIASALIAIGCFMDAGSDNLTRPAELYVSQALIGFASLLFLAQAQLIGIARTLLAGGGRFVSFVVVFGLSQNIGGLAGNALLGTLQTMREKFHSHELVQRIVLTDPLVAGRLGTSAQSATGALGDPVLRHAEAIATLSQQTSREAGILAFNDVFLVLGVFAVAATAWQIVIGVSIRLRGETSPVLQLQRRAAGVSSAGGR